MVTTALNLQLKPFGLTIPWFWLQSDSILETLLRIWFVAAADVIVVVVIVVD